ncbi:DUF2690 domain-containing protein [Nocardia panacis]|uniref:DUF2690 domain-containing protein n=1 Tax=Nocardia panacis TaxID=2340916 RepID=A0A3A4KDF3_9NOCA|nr:DUF2690 domain-containing protein [Nocardia panacis]RJO70895.1 DUF2690 domain-containing protein [Nocardia panacis]
MAQTRTRAFPRGGLFLIALLMVGAVLTALALTSTGRAERPPDHAAVNTGDDPANAECDKDAKPIADSVVTGKLRLEILYSSRCGASWGRITRLDNAGSGNRVMVSLYRRSDSTGGSRQDAVQPDAKSASTTLIVRRTPADRFCATGSTSTGAELLEIRDPICT